MTQFSAQPGPRFVRGHGRAAVVAGILLLTVGSGCASKPASVVEEDPKTGAPVPPERRGAIPMPAGVTVPAPVGAPAQMPTGPGAPPKK